MVTGGEFEDNEAACGCASRSNRADGSRAKEWNGKWSDDSAQWNSRMMQMLPTRKRRDDGTFWMEYADFCKHFNKVYMCRMLDDLWTRFAVKSRWMDETAGGCTNFISWRNNNQWLLHDPRPNTKLIIKLTQPDARKSAGNGRHYSNAIGFYIFKGNRPTGADHYRRKLVLHGGRRGGGRRLRLHERAALHAPADGRVHRRTRTPNPNPNPEPYPLTLPANPTR